MMPLPHIDAHTLLWDPSRFDYPRLWSDLAPLRRVFGPADLATELEREDIGGVVVAQALPSVEETRYLLELGAAQPIIAGVIGWLDLAAPDVGQQLSALRGGPGGHLLVGLRHAALTEPDPEWLRGDAVLRGLEEVAAASLAFDLHVSTRELPVALEVCRMLPGLRFVIDHLAVPPIASGDLRAWVRAILPFGDLPNVSAKVSGLVTEADWLTWSIDDLRHPVELALDTFGAGRLMLGSDWPRCMLAGSYADTIDSCRYLIAELPAHEQDDIRGGTARRVYRLDHHAA